MDKKTQKRTVTPNYKRIYCDLIDRKYPHKKKDCQQILAKERLTFLDVLELDELIFDKKVREDKEMDRKYRAYDKQTILKILDYQKKHQLNNTQVANHFKISRNTIAGWKKSFSCQ